MQKDNLKNETPTDANNVLAVRAFIGKKVNVDIACYSYGFCYPDENILIDVTETEYVCMTDNGEYLRGFALRKLLSNTLLNDSKNCGL